MRDAEERKKKNDGRKGRKEAEMPNAKSDACFSPAPAGRQAGRQAPRGRLGTVGTFSVIKLAREAGSGFLLAGG